MIWQHFPQSPGVTQETRKTLLMPRKFRAFISLSSYISVPVCQVYLHEEIKTTHWEGCGQKQQRSHLCKTPKTVFMLGQSLFPSRIKHFFPSTWSESGKKALKPALFKLLACDSLWPTYTHILARETIIQDTIPHCVHQVCAFSKHAVDNLSTSGLKMSSLSKHADSTTPIYDSICDRLLRAYVFPGK